MSKLYYLILGLITILIFLLLYKTSELALKIENKNVSENVSKAKTQRKVKNKNKFYYILSKKVKLAKHKKEKMEKELGWLGVEMTPEEYTSEYLIKGIIGLVVTIIFLLFKMYIPSFIAFCVSLAIVISEKGKLKSTIQNRRRRVEEEAPFFIRFVNTSLKSSNDLIEVFKEYSNIAKYLKNDIDNCIVEMSSPNSEGNSIVIALENLDERLNTPIIKDFITGIVRASTGEDQSVYFEFLEKEVVKLSIYNQKVKSVKIEKKVRTKILWLACSLIIFLGLILIEIMKEQFNI